RAYRTVRDPIARGRYWLELHGTPLGERNKQVPPALAELVFETQEQLAELRGASDPGAARRGIATAPPHTDAARGGTGAGARGGARWWPSWRRATPRGMPPVARRPTLWPSSSAACPRSPT